MDITDTAFTDEYDVIILGTGLKESILSALLQQKSMKVLNIDRNRYYGGEAASLQLDTLYKKFKNTTPPKSLGDQRYWAVDLCPKFLMASGQLTTLLRVTRAILYMDMSLIPGSYIANSKTIYKVPATAGEATTSTLLGLLERFRFKSMLEFINEFDPAKKYKESTLTARQFFKNYDLSVDAIEFCGHALALHTDDSYLDRNCVETILNIKLYANSLARWGSSPFIYPQWGLGTMSEAFSRLCAINGGLQMLEKKVAGISYNDDGKVNGVVLDEGEQGKITIKAKRVLADPTFIHECKPERVKQTGAIIHSIVFMQTPVPNTKNSSAVQLVIPASQLGRKNDIYVACVNHTYAVCAEGWYIATISTTQEKPGVDPDVELAHAYKLLGGKFADKFTWVTPYFEPIKPESDDCLYVSESQDPTTHFELATKQLLEMYKDITGDDFDFNQPIPEGENM
jgi:Rab GDP dissociation inhibitor